MSQGQGPTTEHKERTFASAMSIGLRVSNAKPIRDFTYFHADLNAGSGYNTERECPGSPVVFYDLATKIRPNFRAFFCDHDKRAIRELRSVDGFADPRVSIHCCDNADLLDGVEKHIRDNDRREYACGSVVIDPNGYFGKNKDGTRCVPDGRLANFARTFPRMDLIFNLNITLYRRAAAHRKNGVPGWVDRFCPHPKELPRIFSRSHGLIQIRPTCGHHFLTLVLRNVKTGDHKKMNLYDIHGRQGSEMLRELRNVGQLELI